MSSTKIYVCMYCLGKGTIVTADESDVTESQLKTVPCPLCVQSGWPAVATLGKSQVEQVEIVDVKATVVTQSSSSVAMTTPESDQR